MAPNSATALPIQCPKCKYDGCTLVVKSSSIMTVTCVSCLYTWSAELAALPEEIKIRVVRDN